MRIGFEMWKTLGRFFWLSRIEFLNVKGFFAFWFIKNVELRPETRDLIIRELLRMQSLNSLEGCADRDSKESNEQRPKNYIGHLVASNL